MSTHVSTRIPYHVVVYCTRTEKCQIENSFYLENFFVEEHEYKWTIHSIDCRHHRRCTSRKASTSSSRGNEEKGHKCEENREGNARHTEMKLLCDFLFYGFASSVCYKIRIFIVFMRLLLFAC